MIIDSPIISGSFAASGSLNQFGNVIISGSLTVTGSIIGTASFATTASYLSGYVSPFPFTGSAIISGSLEVTGSANIPNITGSLLGTASFANTATSSSFATTASFSLNVPVTSSYANNATSASFATTASYLTGYISPFPYTGSAIISGSLTVTGSIAVSNLSGIGTRYLVTDASGSVTAQTASAAIKQTQAFTSSANQTSFTIADGYTTGLVDVFINGSKLAPGVEFTDTSGTVITLATGSNSGDLVEFVKYFPASGVTNNALRQLTTFTASAGQTVFSASYTPGLLDIFYNGSRLSNNEYTANNGTFFTLATASIANDILDVFVYSYQVGAFSGIGGQGVANQVAYFGTTNAITGSPNFTISGSTMTVTGSLVVSGSGTFTNIGPAVLSGSVNISGSLAVGGANVVLSTQTSSLNVATASLAITASSADNFLVRNTLTAQTLVVQTITSSVDFVTGSTQFGSLLSNTHVFSGSVSMNPGGLFVSSSGVVGIGTISPTSVLEVQTNQNAQTGIRVRNSTSGSSAGVEFGAYTNSGNGGFGKYSTGNTPYKNIVAGSTYIYNGASGDIALLNDASTGNISFAAGGSSTAHFILASTGAATFSSSVTVNDVIISNRTKAGSGVESLDVLNLKMSGTNAVGDSINIKFLNNGNTQIANIAGILGADNVAYGSLAFSTRNYNTDSMVEVMRIGNRGNVGIGTTTPNSAYKLDVSGDIRATGTIYANANGTMYFRGGDDCGLHDVNIANTMGIYGVQDSTVGTIRLGSSGGTLSGYSGRIGVNVTTPDQALHVVDTTNDTVMKLGGGGASRDTNFTMFSQSAGNTVQAIHYNGQMAFYSAKFVINANGSASLTGALTQNTSDIRLKTNIAVIENAIDKIKQLSGFTYNWNALANELGGFDTTIKEVGVAAQSVKEVVPEAVFPAPFDNGFNPSTQSFYSKSGENYLTVQYEKLVPLLIEGMKEQQALITELQEKLERNNII